MVFIANDVQLAKPAELELTEVHCSLSEAAAAGVYSVSSTSTVEIGIVSGGASRLLLMGMFFWLATQSNHVVCNGDMLFTFLTGTNRALHVNG